MRKKKILFMTNSGLGLYAFRRELLSCFLEKGYVVTLAYDDGLMHREFCEMGCRCRKLKFESESINPFRDLKMFRDCLRIVRAERPDVVLLYTIKPCIYGGMACKLLGPPCISTVTGISRALLTENRIVSAIAAGLCRIGYSCSEIVFFQNADNERIYSEKRIAPGKHRIVRGSGVNLGYHSFQEYRPKDPEVRILYLGRLLRTKGMEEFAGALRRAKKDVPGLCCRIVGEKCEELPVLERAIEDGLAAYYPQTKDIREFLRWCDVLVMPSYAEGMSNVLQEAAATGRPAMASAVPGCRDVVENGVTGILFEPKSAESIYQAILQFAGLTYEERKSMGKKAREKMEREFDRKKIVEQYADAVAVYLGN